MAALAGCSGGGDSTPSGGGTSTPTYTIGGTVTGVAGSGVQLELLRAGEIDGTGEMLTVAADGVFTFTRTAAGRRRRR